MSDKAANRDFLIERISREESRLAGISRAHEEAEARLEALNKEFAAIDPEEPARAGQVSRLTPISPAEKIALFRSLFRGRPDVFPTHWRNPRKQKSGYSPACSNEWVAGMCEKPRVKCGDCPVPRHYSIPS